MENNPLVTVNILSYNRKHELRNTLSKVFEQNYKNIEVVVVDNASTDGTVEMILLEYSAVKVIPLEKNIGIAGWNKGGEIASGNFILFLDDDSYPEIDSIQKGVNTIVGNNEIGVVGFEIFNTNQNRIENETGIRLYKEKNYSLGFTGCGALVRRDLFAKLNGFNLNIFLYHHEYEFSARVYNCGYKVIILAGARVIHNYSHVNRGKHSLKNQIGERKYYYGFLSLAAFQFANFSFIHTLTYFPKLVLSRLYIAIRLGYLQSFIKAIYFILCRFRVLIKNNAPLSEDVQKLYDYGNIKFNDIHEF